MASGGMRSAEDFLRMIEPEEPFVKVATWDAAE